MSENINQGTDKISESKAENTPREILPEMQKEQEIGMPSIRNTDLPSKELGVSVTQTKLSLIEKNAIKLILNEYFNLGNMEPNLKRNILSVLKKELPSVSEGNINKIYKEAESEFYKKLPRKNPEEIINKINAQSEFLIEKILDTSEKDIVDQAKTINQITETVAKVNRVMDVAPVVEINFKQELTDDYLLNPKQTHIEIKEK